MSLRWRIPLMLIVLALILAGAGYLWLHSSLPRESGRLSMPGLSAPVEIARDAVGVPHITAANDRDAAFALGFVHAQDRLFQMDMMRRSGAGRLAEVVGSAALKHDEEMRILGLYRAAERQYDGLSEPLKQALQAYAAGVNAYLAQRRALPPEYYLLHMSPEAWKPADSLVWGKLMALLLSGNMRNELLHAQLAAKLSPEELATLFPGYPSEAPVAVGDNAALFRALPLERLEAALTDDLGPTFASNNWVVDGAHSVSGKPLLANDPHLEFSAPGIWYLARLDTPEHHISGATSAGTPFVVLGHNERIGWGFTTTEGDVEDVFIEKLDEHDPNLYIAPDGPRAFETRQEEIRVKDAPPVTITIRTTRHGPVISDLGGPATAMAPTGYALALQATFLADDDRSPQALWDLARAGNWDEFNAALESFTAPQQNIVYADIDGTIGFVAPARIPIRAKGDGWVPAPGWTTEYDWTGYVPFAELPRAVNSPAGRFVSANNKIVPDSYPHFIGRDWDIPNRAERITALLDATPKQSPAASASIQADIFSPMSRRLLPLMLRIAPDDARTATALELLRHWDGRMAADRPEPLIFTAWLRELNRTLFAEKLGSSFDSYWGLRSRVIEDILTNHQEWCDAGAARPPDSCDAPLAASLHTVLDTLTRAYGGEIAAWRWGEPHQASFAHPIFSRVPVLRDLMAAEIPADGGSDTVNRGEMVLADPDRPFLDRHGAGLRMILDFADLDSSRFMISPGQSGNPLSPHYKDLMHPWHDFQWLTLGAAAADSAQGRILVLEPR